MLEGKKLKLRALEPSDIDLLYEWENNEKLWYLSNTITPFSRFTLEQYILNSHQDIYTTKQLRLMIDKKNSNQNVTIGSIDLFDFDPSNKRAGIGILISDNERNKGYASEALELLISYCFSTLQLHQIYCNISADNQVSLQLFKKHNFSSVGLKKEWIFVNNKWVDEFILQLINT
ncbi:MAG: GNAT family N-acetyltransferase [Bacteroidales bacterium]|nr:GNAT family N-acetyltransferase [Bacteroidales bacterium]